MKKIVLLLTVFSVICMLLLATSNNQALAQVGQIFQTVVGDPEYAEQFNDEGVEPVDPDSDFIFYCQRGPINEKGVLIGASGGWNYDYSGGRCEVNANGCGPTALSMGLKYFGANKMNPRIASRDTGSVNCDGGTNKYEIETSWKRYIENNGYTMSKSLVPYQSSGSRVPLKVMKDRIDKGFLIVAGAAIRYASWAGLTPPRGHAFIITDVNPGTKSITIYDPTFCYPNFPGGKRKIKDSVTLGKWLGCDYEYSNACGWFYAYAIKK